MMNFAKQAMSRIFQSRTPRKVNYGRTINCIVIHCTASSQQATVQAILDYFKNTLGWKSPGYHFMIDPAGIVHNTHPIGKVSNGVRGHNRDTVHISYIGGKTVDDRTPAQISSMKNLIIKLRSELGNIPVKGHRDFSKDLNGNGIIEKHEWMKLCPNFDVAEWMRQEGI